MMRKVGIIGGGQLGKMMILDGKRLDVYFVILDPNPDCPASCITDKHIVAKFDDTEAIKLLASQVDVVTYEFEHINVEALRQIEVMGHTVYPSSETLYKIQDKYRQKQYLQQNNIPIPAFQKIDSLNALYDASKNFGFPVVLKTCTGGYDGKGNYIIQEEGDIETAFQALGSGKIPLMVEQFIQCNKEISILACRSSNGDFQLFPVAENTHVNSILDETVVPARISDTAQQQALNIAKNVLDAFGSFGMLCIEMFVADDNTLFVNELAPRPHNSGHYTIEGCVTSQFEQHVRAILGLPLGSTKLISPIVMKNIIGTEASSGDYEGLESAYQFDRVKVHMYGKKKSNKGRKMGHIVALDDDLDKAIEVVKQAHGYITFKK